MNKRILFLITARKGSRGLPGKNIKTLGEKPLVQYSYDFAASVQGFNDEICISTNDEKIIQYFSAKGHKLHFKRPDELSTSQSTSDSVIEHALKFFEKQGSNFEYVMLLQPTSPFREKIDFENIFKLMKQETDMVVSVKECKDSPYFNQFKENESQHLVPIVEAPTITRRQDVPKTYAYNGAFYFFKVASFNKEMKMSFNKIRKYVMPIWRSIDIDTQEDWELALHYVNRFIK